MNNKKNFFDLTEPSNCILKLVHPTIGDTGATLTLIPPTSQTYVDRLTIINAQKLREAPDQFKKEIEKEIGPDNVKDFTSMTDQEWLDFMKNTTKWEAREIAAVVEDWSEEFGEPFNREKLVEMLMDSNYSWIKMAIYQKMKDDSAFFLNGKTD